MTPKQQKPYNEFRRQIGYAKTRLDFLEQSVTRQNWSEANRDWQALQSTLAVLISKRFEVQAYQ
jgi:hypothetical protein